MISNLIVGPQCEEENYTTNVYVSMNKQLIMAVTQGSHKHAETLGLNFINVQTCTLYIQVKHFQHDLRCGHKTTLEDELGKNVTDKSAQV